MTGMSAAMLRQEFDSDNNKAWCLGRCHKNPKKAMLVIIIPASMNRMDTTKPVVSTVGPNKGSAHKSNVSNPNPVAFKAQPKRAA